MNFITGRPDHIEDFLVLLEQVHGSVSDSKNKSMQNLIVHDGRN